MCAFERTLTTMQYAGQHIPVNAHTNAARIHAPDAYAFIHMGTGKRDRTTMTLTVSVVTLFATTKVAIAFRTNYGNHKHSDETIFMFCFVNDRGEMLVLLIYNFQIDYFIWSFWVFFVVW